MTIIALLNLPLELPPDAPARSAGLSSFVDKLPEWLSRCMPLLQSLSSFKDCDSELTITKARRMKGAYQTSRAQKRMERLHSARWLAPASSAIQKS